MDESSLCNFFFLIIVMEIIKVIKKGTVFHFLFLFPCFLLRQMPR